MVNASKLARTSLSILLAHRARTLVSCGAVFIGVAALVLMVGAGQAGERDLRAQIREMGSNILAVRAGHFQTVGRHVQQVSRTTTLLPRDVELLRRQLLGVRRLAAVATATKVVRSRAEAQALSIVGVDPEYFELQRLVVARGRAFSAEEDRGLARVAVVGATAAHELFELDDPIGQQVRVGGVPFEIIGVTAKKGGGLFGADPDQDVYVPLSALLSRLLGRSWVDVVLVQADSPALFPVLRQDIAEDLRRAHHLAAGRPDDFTIQDPAALLAAEHEMGEAFRALVGGVAGVSLATGGIGIIAVMLMTVRERTREIGLRRAIGATRRAILFQFLFEASLLTGLGGLAGALIALPANALICRLAGWPIVWPVAAMLAGTAFSVGLGVLCGIAPAVRAARLEPAIAVRAAE